MSDIGKPAYQGRPDPTRVADRAMLLLTLLLIAGFLQAGIKNGWFSSLIDFILS